MQVVVVAKDFSKYPAGRYKTDGPFSGEKFREEILLPLLEKGDEFSINLDGTRGYGSSFLEEAFGGLVRAGYSKDQINKVMHIKSSLKSYLIEIAEYINDADKDGN